ncbi:hypothetical protein K2F54_05180 [Cryobacterium sp. 1639]|uniref:hypothetical protein n=1 Tax=Cryobacterium inferilacus TaxID=2866629 RepID=UPI001C73D293|nr:hypothetical protein [Cryobacterium sp. 1639]MBX0299368.1 hypothetical protein [Cryobacterium sp. 1639]
MSEDTAPVDPSVEAAGPHLPAAIPAKEKGPAWYDKVNAWVDRQPVVFEGVTMKAGILSYKRERQPVTGVQVTVETAGELQRRSTLTRTAAGAIVFGPAGAVVGALFRKQVDRRELYLLVDGDLFAWAVNINPSKGAAARAFAAKVNTAARG